MVQNSPKTPPNTTQYLSHLSRCILCTCGVLEWYARTGQPGVLHAQPTLANPYTRPCPQETVEVATPEPLLDLAYMLTSPLLACSDDSIPSSTMRASTATYHPELYLAFPSLSCRPETKRLYTCRHRTAQATNGELGSSLSPL